MNLKNLLLTTFALMPGLAVNAQAQEALYVDPLGNVGIGTASPTKKLQVDGVDDANIYVRNTSPTGAERLLFTLQNKGKTRFMIANGPNAWTFDNAGNNFQISKVGTGKSEFQVYDNGDGYFAGDVYADQVLLTSSRERKTDFEAVDSSSVLQLLDQLEILSWRYKEDDAADRHIGPVAEDFQSVFKLGNGKNISAVDTSGIAFAAIKGLHEESRQQAAQLEALQAENQRLLTTNAELEKRLQKLEKLLIPADLASAD